jgi:hypothetical protein
VGGGGGATVSPANVVAAVTQITPAIITNKTTNSKNFKFFITNSLAEKSFIFKFPNIST